MNNAWQKYVETASGLTELTRQRAESVVRSLVKQGEIAADRTEKAVDELLARSEENRKAASAVVRAETQKAISKLGLARKEQVAGLQRRVRQLEAELAAAKGGGAGVKKASGKKAAGKKAAGKKAAGKKSAAAKRNRKKSSAKRAGKKS